MGHAMYTPTHPKEATCSTGLVPAPLGGRQTSRASTAKQKRRLLPRPLPRAACLVGRGQSRGAAAPPLAGLWHGHGAGTEQSCTEQRGQSHIRRDRGKARAAEPHRHLTAWATSLGAFGRVPSGARQRDAGTGHLHADPSDLTRHQPGPPHVSRPQVSPRCQCSPLRFDSPPPDTQHSQFSNLDHLAPTTRNA